MFFGVVLRRWLVVWPTLTVQAGPSVRNTILAGTCSDTKSALPTGVVWFGKRGKS